MRTLAAGLIGMALLAGCGGGGGADRQAAEAARLLATDRAFAAASLEQGTGEAFFAAMTDDAVQLPANAPPVQGRAQVRERLGRLGAEVLDWTPQKAEVARSLDLGWSWGEWRLLQSAASRKVLAHGKYLNIWKRQADGAWKLAVDLGNQAEEEPAAAPPAGGS